MELGMCSITTKAVFSKEFKYDIQVEENSYGNPILSMHIEQHSMERCPGAK